MCKWMKKYEKMVKKMTMGDIALLKTAVIAVSLLIAKLWSPILSLEWYWYGLVAAVCSCWLIKRIW